MAAQLLTLAADHVIDGLKDSSGDLAGMREVIIGTRSQPEFAVFTGSELIVDCAMQVGASGSVPGLGNVDPNGFVDLYRSCRAGDWDKARSQQERSDHAVRDHQLRKTGHGQERLRPSVGSRPPSCSAG